MMVNSGEKGYFKMDLWSMEGVSVESGGGMARGESML